MPNRLETEAEYTAVASAARAETVLAASVISVAPVATEATNDQKWIQPRSRGLTEPSGAGGVVVATSTAARLPTRRSLRGRGAARPRLRRLRETVAAAPGGRAATPARRRDRGWQPPVGEGGRLHRRQRRAPGRRREDDRTARVVPGERR